MQPEFISPDFNARLLEEAAVNADFTELILNEDQLLLAVTLGNHFADQSRLAGSQETRVVEIAMEDSIRGGFNYVGTEHLLAGIFAGGATTWQSASCAPLVWTPGSSTRR